MLQAWGKTDKDSGEIHPLAHHSMDVAAVFAGVLQLPVIRDRLEAAADAALTEMTCRRLAALAFLHDIGKLHPGFQAKGWASGRWKGPTTGHSKESWAFLILAVQWPAHPFHGTIRRILDWGEALPPLMGAMFAHHGRPVEPPSAPTLREWPSLTHYDWRTEARRMGDALQRWFPEAFEAGGEHLPGTSRFCHEIAGLAALADWIGSDTQFFEFEAPFASDYDTRAHDAAARALTAIGFDSRVLAATPPPSFSWLGAWRRGRAWRSWTWGCRPWHAAPPLGRPTGWPVWEAVAATFRRGSREAGRDAASRKALSLRQFPPVHAKAGASGKSTIGASGVH